MTAKKRYKRASWSGYASILRRIQVLPCTTQEIATETGIRIEALRKILWKMLDLKLIHRGGWVRTSVRGPSVPVWHYGHAPCAPRLGSWKAMPRDPHSRWYAKPEVVAFAHIMRALAEPVTKAELVEATGSTWANLARLLKHCRDIGLVRIAEWDVRLHGGAPAALFQIGSGRDAPRPPRQSRRVIGQRSRAARKAKMSTAAMIAATAMPSNSPRVQEAA